MQTIHLIIVKYYFEGISLSKIRILGFIDDSFLITALISFSSFSLISFNFNLFVVKFYSVSLTILVIFCIASLDISSCLNPIDSICGLFTKVLVILSIFIDKAIIPLFANFF